MLVKKVKKHGQQGNFTYTGEVGNTRVTIVFENEAIPTEGNLEVINGKMVTKGNLNYYYIKGYRRVEN